MFTLPSHGWFMTLFYPHWRPMNLPFFMRSRPAVCPWRASRSVHGRRVALGSLRRASWCIVVSLGPQRNDDILVTYPRCSSYISQMLHVWKCLPTFAAKNGPNVSRYSIHGAFGYVWYHEIDVWNANSGTTHDFWVMTPKGRIGLWYLSVCN